MDTNRTTVTLEELTDGRTACPECLAITGAHIYPSGPCTENHDALRVQLDTVEARQAVLAPHADRVRNEAERIEALLPTFDLDTAAGILDAAETLAYAIATTHAEYPQYDDYVARRCFGIGVARRTTNTKLGTAFKAGDVVLVTGEHNAWSWRNGISTSVMNGTIRLVARVDFTGPNHDLTINIGRG